MSLEDVRQVSRDNPTWLPTNLGRTCYAHTVELIRRLRAAGHEAYLVCKLAGEGGYTPPGFAPRTEIGLDGKPYTIARVSHDVIFFRERGSSLLQQFDTLASANEYDRPIYRRQGDPNWSFDPNDGPQITASDVWNEVPPSLWRAWNPPLLEDDAPVPMPVPQPAPAPVMAFPPRDETASFMKSLNLFYRDKGRQNRSADNDALYVDNEGLAVWMPEYLRRRVLGESHADATTHALADVEAAWPR